MRFAYIVAVTLLAASAAAAATVQVTVAGTADVWLAGQANGTILQGIFPLNDASPANSPVLASTGLNMTAGSSLTVSVTGSTNYNGCQSTTPDGNPCGNFTTTTAGPYFGIATYTGPANALVGVFIGAGTPGGAAPAGLDFSSGASQAQATISPLLNQVFFIGDGLTGTGSGAVQQFVIPAGATRLFLGSADSAGANYNNSGSFAVSVSDTGPTGQTGPGGSVAAPAVSAPLLAVLGMLLAAVSAYLLRAPRADSAS